MFKYINMANSARTLQIQESNRIKIINWLENRKNKTIEEEKALICAKKDYKFLLGIIYFIVCIIYIAIIIYLLVTLEEESDKILLLQIPILACMSIIMIYTNSIVNRNYNRLVERIAKFTDLYLSEGRNKFSIIFNGSSISDYDFAKNFVHYANQHPDEFEEKWSKIKPYSVIEKLRNKLVVFILLLLIFGLPIYFCAFRNSGISLNNLISYMQYDIELQASEYIIVDTKYNEQKELIVTIKYTIDSKEYISDVKVKGNKWDWRMKGGLYYNESNPEKLKYIED